MTATGETPAIVWFRQDLRLRDNAALAAAVKDGHPLILLFVLDDTTLEDWTLGGASRWWLHHSLKALGSDVEKLGGRLVLKRGASVDCVRAVADQTGAGTIYFSRGYDPHAVTLEAGLKEMCGELGMTPKRYSGHLLVEPESIETKTGGPYKVYTPFSRAVMGMVDAQLKPAPEKLAGFKGALDSDQLEDWALLPTDPDWSTGFDAHWQPGEAGAEAKLTWFLENALKDYDELRNRPDIRGTSQLSPHLRFGEISPRQVWSAVRAFSDKSGGSVDAGAETFLKEIVWREFSYHLLFHFPHLPEESFRDDFNAFPWRENAEMLRAWQKGQTGYPIVDAGMRELWHTGWMHNRVRMIVGSFLVKHLLLHWRHGEDWFWDCLVDADMASNSASWQWVAGSGADAAPYFRIFNPILQGEKFDPDGAYVRKWCPELENLPTKYLFAPWNAPQKFLDHAGVVLGKTYPKPIVDHKAARQQALDAYEAVKAAKAA